VRSVVRTLEHARGSHPGLLLQRYLVRPADTAARDGEPSDARERRALFHAVQQSASGAALCELYADAFARWTGSFSPDGHRAAQLTTTSRLVIGLGVANILETGFRLHQTYGVPIIPGSALKGVAAQFCHERWGQAHDPAAAEGNQRFRRGGTYHTLLFGTTDDGGAITFHDAWITPESMRRQALGLDVMTPHHTEWQLGEAPPSDLDGPVPISFLSVTGTFDVRVSWSGTPGTPAAQIDAWTTLAMTLLQEALDDGGVGGKTRSGYGRLVPPERARSRASGPSKPVVLPRAGERVQARLLADKTRAGGWKAMHLATEISGPIQNTSEVPADKVVGDTVELSVASATSKEIAFRYPTAADQPGNKPAGPQGAGKPRGPGGGAKR
jgi:CRISPR-associated protein Cmr6